MAGMNLAMEIFEAIEADVGRENAWKVAKAVDTVVVRMEEKTHAHSLARKVEIKDELKRELRDELATKADLADVRSALKGDIASLKLRTTVQFLVTIFVIVLLNPQALQLLGRMLGLLK
jgi:hypothetical protein